MRYFLLLVFITCLSPFLSAGDGMWLPLLLDQLNEKEMKSMGMKISAEDIYSINKGSLKDAIVHFGGFCTGEVISAEGLLLTNHHCGYSAIQQHSSLENNLLENGFWAKDHGEERPNEGLYVTFIERIEEVTDKALKGVHAGMSEAERKLAIEENLASVRKRFRLSSHEELLIKPFYAGNQYFAFVTKKFTDIRLVGTPPSSIGKYGADTDNWEWPRFTGDFSLFRIYTDPDGNPADYAPENVPLQAKTHLKISLQGIQPGDFSMVMGFPSSTDQYLPASAMAQRTEVINPLRIGMRDRSLAVIDSAMRADPQLKINYASRQARIANYWKKWRGESEGTAAVNGIEKRRTKEATYRQRAVAKEGSEGQYSRLLDEMNAIVSAREPFAKTRAIVAELNYNIDLFRVANLLHREIAIADTKGMKVFKQRLPAIARQLDRLYAGMDIAVDEKVARALLPFYFDRLPMDHQSFYVQDQVEFAGSRQQMITDLYQRSYLSRGDRLLQLLREKPETARKVIEGDPGFQFVAQLNAHHEKSVLAPYESYAERYAPLARQYQQALIRFFPERRFYPDANRTLRVSYGKFEGFTGLDGQRYDYMTYLDGVIARYVPDDYEFDLPQRLRDLHAAKDYGPYATPQGKLPVCILGSNHTSGGNSGSPALNGEGLLVGLNFDRTWQSTMSDINYDPDICRNIMVDIRYVLFLIDKVGGAGHLVDEMTLVK